MASGGSALALKVCARLAFAIGTVVNFITPALTALHVDVILLRRRALRASQLFARPAFAIAALVPVAAPGLAFLNIQVIWLRGDAMPSACGCHRPLRVHADD